MADCINPKASEAGWIVSYCNCELCLKRKADKANGKGTKPEPAGTEGAIRR